MKCPLLWKTTIDPVSLASDSIHFCPALALHPGIHLTGADHRLDSLAFFRALPGSRVPNGGVQLQRICIVDELTIWTARGPGWQRRPRASKQWFFWGEGFGRSLFLLETYPVTRPISWPSHGCIMPAHGMFACSKKNWTMQVSFTRKAETKEGQFRKLEDQEMEIGRSI